MTVRLLQRRTMWWPTWLGWLVLCVFALGPLLFWWFRGEAFLSVTHPVPADVLVVEGWISSEGIRASVQEFKQGHYRYVVATGGLTGETWSSQRWSYAIEAEEQLLRSGIPREQVILAASRETGSQRTYEMALSAWQALQSRGIKPSGINVFTRGAHARRSRTVFVKVFGPDTRIGVISWTAQPVHTERWWRSSERSEDMIKETIGYIFEFLLDSGRDYPPPTAPRQAQRNGGTTSVSSADRTEPVPPPSSLKSSQACMIRTDISTAPLSPSTRSPTFHFIPAGSHAASLYHGNSSAPSGVSDLGFNPLNRDPGTRAVRSRHRPLFSTC